MPQKWKYVNELRLSLVSLLIVGLISISLGVWNLFPSEENVNKDTFDVIIGILSARENFQQRKGIRDSWLKYISENETLKQRVAYKFIVGSEDCTVPLSDRLSLYSCQWDPFIKATADDNILAYRVPLLEKPEETVIRGPIGLDFQVQHPVVITHLGVYDSLLDGVNGQIKVSIYDQIKKEEIVWTYFHGNDSDDIRNKFRFKIVDQYMLPKGFQGSFVIDGLAEDDLAIRQKQNCWTDDGGGLIIFKKVFRHGRLPRSFPEIVEKYRNSTCHVLAGSFVYKPFNESIVDDASLAAKECLERFRQREKDIQSVEQRITAESLKYKDLLFVDVKDVYRNLPLKVLQFYKWVSKQINFKFTLKTDDDCFLNIPEILKIMDEEKLSSISRLWWSRFRFHWPLDHYGKWAEEDYTSITYPAFACGAGNVLSSDLTQWMAANYDKLKAFQGEDVSVGIWLSPLAPTLVNDYRWSCFQDCRRNMLSSPNYSPDELREMFKMLKSCGNPCHCPEY